MADRLELARCASCSTLQHPPSPMCPVCGSLQWTTQEAAGFGTVLSWIVSRHPSRPDAEPRIVALIELDEGPRLVSNLQDIDIEDVRNDMRVQVVFREVKGQQLHQFVPLESSR
ncbi:MAG: OB-fold domain-containing protein [Acidimicrobiaceae bacterium]|nr:OB-fold domain-containing protein [Acidimicrobiaceae bacterium]